MPTLPMPLQFIARQACIKQLLDDNPDTILCLLETECFTPVSESLLQQIVKCAPDQLTNGALLALLPGGRKKLDLSKCEAVTLMGLVHALKRCSNIQHLILDECSQLMCDDIFTFMGLMQLPITHLSLEHTGNLTDSMVNMLIERLPHLTILNVSDNCKLTELAFFVDPEDQLQKELHAASTSEPQPEFSYKYNLASVDVSGCRGMRKDAMLHLSSLCGPKLKHVNLSWTGVESVGLLFLAGFNLVGALQVMTEWKARMAEQGDQPKFDSTEIESMQTVLENMMLLEGVKTEIGTLSSSLKLDAAVSTDVQNDEKLDSNADASEENDENIHSTGEILVVSTTPPEFSDTEENIHIPYCASSAKHSDVVDMEKDSDSIPCTEALAFSTPPEFSNSEKNTDFSLFANRLNPSNDGDTGDPSEINAVTEQIVLTALSEHSDTEENTDLPLKFSDKEQCTSASGIVPDDIVLTVSETSVDKGHDLPHVDTSTGEDCDTETESIPERTDHRHTDCDTETESIPERTDHRHTDCDTETESIPERTDHRHTDCDTETESIPERTDHRHTDCDIETEHDAAHISSIKCPHCNIELIKDKLVEINRNKETSEEDSTFHADLCVLMDNVTISTQQKTHGRTDIRNLPGDTNSAAAADELSELRCEIADHQGEISSKESTKRVQPYVLMDKVTISTQQKTRGRTDIRNLPGDTNSAAATDELSELRCEIADQQGEKRVEVEEDTGQLNKQIDQLVLVSGNADALTGHQHFLKPTLPKALSDEQHLPASSADHTEQSERELRCEIADHQVEISSNSCSNESSKKVEVKEVTSQLNKQIDQLELVSGNVNDEQQFLVKSVDHTEQSERDSACAKNEKHNSNDLDRLAASKSSADHTEEYEGESVCAINRNPNNLKDLNNENANESNDLNNENANNFNDLKSENTSNVSDLDKENHTNINAADTTKEGGGNYPLSDASKHLKDMKEGRQGDNFASTPTLFQSQLLGLDITAIKLQKMEGPFCLKKFLQHNKTLQKLCVSWRGLSGELLRENLVENLTDLKEVELVECTMLQTEGVMALGNHCPKLSKINLRCVDFFKDVGIRPILSLPCLTSLSLAGSEVTDESLIWLVEKQAQSLQELDLSWCENITEKGINALCEKCTNLRVLNLRKCQVSDASLLLLSESCPLLTSLSLECVEDYTSTDFFKEAGLLAIAGHLRNLTTLDISWNLTITDRAVRAIFSGCVLLDTAIMNGIKTITTAPFMPIIADCEDLREQEVHAAQEVVKDSRPVHAEDEDTSQYSDTVPTRSCVYAPNLRVLELEYCDLVDETCLKKIVIACQGQLKVTDYYGQKVGFDDD